MLIGYPNNILSLAKQASMIIIAVSLLYSSVTAAQNKQQVQTYGICAKIDFDYDYSTGSAISRGTMTEVFSLPIAVDEYSANLSPVPEYATDIKKGPTVESLILEFAGKIVPGQTISKDEKYGDYYFGPPHRTNPNGSGMIWCKLSVDSQLISYDLARLLGDRNTVGRVSWSPSTGSRQSAATSAADATVAKQDASRKAAAAKGQSAKTASVAKKPAPPPAKKSTCNGPSCGVH